MDKVETGEFHKAIEAKAFMNMLRAFYQQPLEIDGYDDLNYMTDDAKFYGCLPIVSYALNATLSRGDEEGRYLNDIPPHHGPNLIASAASLRNASLFKECVVLCAGPWKDPEFCEESFRHEHDREKYFMLPYELYKRISESIASVHWDFITCSTRGDEDDNKTRDEKAAWRHTMEVTAEKLKSRTENHDIPRAEYYRSLLDEEFGPFGCEYIREELKDLLENRLPINRRAEAGKADFKEHFISVQVYDHELPWDVNDTSMDW